MSNLGGSYELLQIGGDHPHGTVDELRREGLDPEKVSSCAPKSPGVRGCNHWADCPFHLTRLGGFKGQGPHYVAYYLKTHEGDEKEDVSSCYLFTKTLLARMRASVAFADRGLPHEKIRIIAQEGGKYLKTTDEAMDKNNNKTGDLRRKITRAMAEVPEFPRPGSVDHIRGKGLLSQRERERELAEQDAEGPYVRQEPGALTIEAVPDLEARPDNG